MGLVTPHIYEYDTLSSEERWDEGYDVILANPPFMSPKGGIRPHKKFTISSNRSEVMFVDYIAEHLNPKGRAGIIVPEGVIFQSGTAYKELRKMLVENYLYAVVSLPAGVFNPYSGVKTSILLMDRETAKKKKEILFVKIDNDGYGLGAQRNAVKGGQLEEAIKIIYDFVAPVETMHAVPKKEIAKNGDYNLSGERYKVDKRNVNSEWEIVPFDEICHLQRGYDLPKQDWINGKFPIVGSNGIIGFHNKYKEQGPGVVTGRSGTIGKVHYIDYDFYWPHNTSLFVKDFKGNNPKYIKLLLEFLDLKKMGAATAAVPSLDRKNVHRLLVPNPPLSIQDEIVSEIEGYQKIIDGAKMVVANYKPHIDIDPDWEMVELGEVFSKSTNSVIPQNLKTKTINYIGLDNISQGSGDLVGEYHSDPKEIKSTKIVFAKTNILYGKLRPNLNKVYYAEIDGICSTDIFVLIGNKNVDTKFYASYFLSEKFNNEVLKGLKGAQLPRVGYEHFSTLVIPYPPIEAQQQIVAQIEKEQAMVNASKQLIEIFEQKIKDRIAKVWGAGKKETVVYEENDLVMMAAEPDVAYNKK